MLDLPNTYVFFFEKVEYNILQFVFILLPASVGIVSFGVIPIAAIINIIPSLITPNKVGLIIEALGLYIAICTVLALNLSTNKLKESK
jgi:hypothetical protein